MAFVLVLVIIVIAAALLIYARIAKSESTQIRNKLEIGEGKVVYSDLDKPAEPISFESIGLIGRPDYVVKQGSAYIPVEVKGLSANEPYENHVMQLVSYCMLVQEKYGTKVPYGILVYKNKDFKIEFNHNLRADFLRFLKDMRTKIDTGNLKRSHNSAAKCASCSFNHVCAERL